MSGEVVVRRYPPGSWERAPMFPWTESDRWEWVGGVKRRLGLLERGDDATARPASLPVPNDDPRCHCALEPGEVAEGATVITGVAPGIPEIRVALHADCPHHGPVVRAVQQGALWRLSIGRRA